MPAEVVPTGLDRSPLNRTVAVAPLSKTSHRPQFALDRLFRKALVQVQFWAVFFREDGDFPHGSFKFVPAVADDVFGRLVAAEVFFVDDGVDFFGGEAVVDFVGAVGVD